MEPKRNTASGIPLEPFYRARPFDPARLGDPGQFPYTRGRHAGARSKAGWIQHELSGEGSPRASNAQFHRLLGHGATGLDVIGDAPTMGLVDADHPLAASGVGTTGVSLCRLTDYRDLLEGVPLERVSVSQSLPTGAFGIAALFLVARERGVDPAVLRGSLIQLPLYQEDCAYAVHLPIAARMRLARDSIVFASKAMPRFHPFLEDTYYVSDGGLDVVEEMALGFVELRAVVRHVLARGVPIDAFAPRIAVLVNCRMDLFEEIAKVRATRRPFATMMRDEFGAKDPRSLSTVVTVHTSGLTLTAQQPVNNVVRGAVQALAMAMAGVQALEISTFDEAYRTPSAAAHLVALRTQQILALETNVAAVQDPLGGSYYVEALTDELERRIVELIARIEAAGDPLVLAEQGYFRRIIEAAAVRYARSVEDGSRPIVGLNVHQLAPEEDTLLRAEAEEKFATAQAHVERVRAEREQRDRPRLHHALQALFVAGRDPEADLMEPILQGYLADATVGEMAGVLRESYQQPYDPYRQLKSPLAGATP